MYTNKEKASKLNFEQLKKQLMDIYKPTLFALSMATVGYLLFRAVISMLFEGVGAPLIVFGVIALLLFAMLGYIALNMLKIYKGRFYAVEDELVRTDERAARGGLLGYRVQKIFYFMLHGEYLISMSDQKSITEYSKLGDRFYLIFLEGKRRPVKIYNKRVYELQEDLVVKMKTDI